ncbi:D-alanine aminotransferase [Pseudovibrio axinellae]|uniref:Probable branched-chain-amino-acid aminotransferase n=1 Tax=Pseudovibrio axinellae TaxID=989403 RepID=A0A165UP35_9HYPH|nr:D-amino-acid transaminase [Pseudovibrio axinellae]KZL12637.1 D-alanine aminotransferase [Pseudovibrio axinellae]SEP63461.1 D-alanine transaminase [Pseudovibrio axinellae]
MSRVAYVNGQYVPHSQAAVHIEDRGYQFSDGVYEVCEIWKGHIVDMGAHLDRLDRSLRELQIKAPMSRAALSHVMKEVISLNRVKEGIIYMQVTRGVAVRDHYFPSDDTPPSVVMTAKSINSQKLDQIAAKGVGVITVEENRWDRVDIKTVGLLPNVLAKQKAKVAGAREAWFVDKDGLVTEGGSTNAWIILSNGTLVTRPANHGILKGITRAGVLKLAEMNGLSVEERGFSIDEAKSAKEAFITSASGIVMPVVKIDETILGDGKPGPIVQDLRKSFHDASELIKLEVAGG